MPTLEGSVVIQAQAEQLFWWSQDYDMRLQWDKYLRIARLEQEETVAGKGVKAYCESRKGIGMTVRYISFHPPTQVAMEMTKGPWVFQKFSGSWRFKKVDERYTRVYFRYNFQSKFGSVGRWFFQPFLKWLLQADINKRLQYFKAAVENGLWQK